MHVKRGEVYGFIGKNGAGKSTTMNIICGLLKKESGEAFLDSKDVSKIERIPVGYLPEAPALLDYMNCYQYLDYIAAASLYEGDIKKRTQEVINLVGLSDAAHRKIGGYSRGMKQRVGIAAALYRGHEIIILDEPTSALDPQGRAEVISLIEMMRKMGKTILLSTHILSDVERVADRVGILNNGVLEEEDTIQNLLDRYSDNIISFETTGTAQGLPEKIKELSVCENLAVNGNTFFVWTKGDFQQANQALFSFLNEQQIWVSRYQLQKMTLEQVYIKVVNKPCK
jgi:ABC-2 type transport system ATP-binding protein